MASEDILHDLARIKRAVADAAKEHGDGRDISGQLSSIFDELGHLLEKAEARLEDIDRESLDARTRFIADLAAGFLQTMISQQGGAAMGSEVKQAVQMAAEVVNEARARA